MQFVARGWLPDHSLKFRRRTHLGHGALDVCPSLGDVVPGAIFRCGPREWHILDRKEGFREGASDNAYERTNSIVLDARARESVAETYRVVAPDPFVEPEPAYLDKVLTGYRELRISGQSVLEAAARNGPAPRAVAGLFVYGSLMRDGELHNLVAAHVRASTRAWTLGEMLDLGRFPGFVIPSRGTRARVLGELLEMRDPAMLLAITDRLESFQGYGRRGNLYRRALVRLRNFPSRPLAWIYVYAGTSAERKVPGGEWATWEKNRSAAWPP